MIPYSRVEFETNISPFMNFTLPQIQNTDPITETIVQKPFIYFGTILTILITIFAITFFFYIKCKQKPIHFINSIQENFEDNERGVMFFSQKPSQIHPHNKILF